MKTEIIKDLDNGIFEIKREFNADKALVWRTWTESAFLDQWWAPRPWACETKNMSFTKDGKWLYDMVGPNGERHGAIQIYTDIHHEEFFRGKDAFTDTDGNINEALPVAVWMNLFFPTANGTLVHTIAKYPDAEALQTVINMGMEQGLQMAQGNLDELLEQLKK